MSLAEVLAGVDAAVHPAQPFAINQAGPGAVHDNAGALQTFNGFGEETVGSLVVGQHGLRTCERTEAPVRSAGARVLFEFRHGLSRGFLVTDASGRFNQFVKTPAVKAEVLVLTRLTSRRECLLISAQAVVEHRGGIPGQAEQAAFPSGHSVRGSGLD